MARLRLAMAGPNSVETNALVKEFFTRNERFLAAVVKKTLLPPGHAGIRDIVDDALCTFLQSLAEYDDSDYPADDADYDRKLRSYLVGRARLQLRRAWRRDSFVGCDTVDLAEYELTAPEPKPDSEVDQPSPRMRIFRARMIEFMKTLTPLQLDVVKLYYLDDHFGRRSDRLPNHLAQAVADRHGTTVENLRQIKHQLKKRIITLYPDM